MRLTVRTLLAYLDHVLPEDAAKSLEVKLKESAYATMLADRIKATVKRSDLNAPAVDAKHPIEDPNAIAEYLDNVMATEHVPELERVLLDSEVHMSEAAACHQILSIVLSQPATVSASLRDRILAMQAALPAAGESVSSLDLPVANAPLATGADNVAMATDIASPAQPFPASAASPAIASHGGRSNSTKQGAAAAGVTRRKPDVPEYLRTGQRSLALPMLLTLGLCAALLFIIVKAYSPLTRLSQQDAALRDAAERPPIESEADLKSEPITIDTPADEGTRAGTGTPAGDAKLALGSPADSASPADGITNNNSNGNTNTAPNGSPKPDVVDAEKAVAAKPADSVSAIDSASPASADKMRTENVVKTDTPAGAGAGAGASEIDDVDPTSMVPKPDAGLLPPEATAIPGVSGTDAVTVPAAAIPGISPIPVPDVMGTQTNVDDPLAAAAALGPGIAIGKLLTSDTALVDQNTGIPLAQDAKINANVRYHNLPLFHSEIALDSGLTLTLVDVTEVLIAGKSVGGDEGESGDEGNAGVAGVVNKADDASTDLHLLRGKCLLQTSKPSTLVRVKLGDRQCELTLSSEGTIVALTATRFRAAGSDPELPGSGKPLIAVHVVNGEVGLAVDGDQAVQLTQQVRWSQLGDEPPKSDLPESVAWVQAPSSHVVSVDTIARKGLLEELAPDVAITQSLRKALDSNRGEVVSLAARSLLSLGETDFYFTAKGIFANQRQKSHWGEHVLALQKHIDVSAKQAIALRESITRADPDSAKLIYRMLWGYSPEQLVNGSDFDLVEALDNPVLCVRVLAIENLHQITGDTNNYRPYETAVRRTEARTKWARRYESKAVRWSKPLTPLDVLQR